ncbi:MAG: hypothetical protein ACR2FH_01125 [Caulobacteraceae bacterium]
MDSKPVHLGGEIRDFESAADRVALGDLEIRRAFARNIVWLFVAANLFVFAGLGLIFWRDCVQLADRQIGPGDRIIDGKVIMALLGATTVQLGAAVYTIARAIFPALPVRAA